MTEHTENTETLETTTAEVTETTTTESDEAVVDFDKEKHKQQLDTAYNKVSELEKAAKMVAAEKSEVENQLAAATAQLNESQKDLLKAQGKNTEYEELVAKEKEEAELRIQEERDLAFKAIEAERDLLRNEKLDNERRKSISSALDSKTFVNDTTKNLVKNLFDTAITADEKGILRGPSGEMVEQYYKSFFSSNEAKDLLAATQSTGTGGASSAPVNTTTSSGSFAEFLATKDQ